MFIQGDESQIAIAEFFLFCSNLLRELFYSVLRIPYAVWIIIITELVLPEWIRLSCIKAVSGVNAYIGSECRMEIMF